MEMHLDYASIYQDVFYISIRDMIYVDMITPLIGNNSLQ